MEGIFPQSSHLVKSDHSRTHGDAKHGFEAFEWENLQKTSK